MGDVGTTYVGRTGFVCVDGVCLVGGCVRCFCSWKWSVVGAKDSVSAEERIVLS